MHCTNALTVLRLACASMRDSCALKKQTCRLQFLKLVHLISLGEIQHRELFVISWQCGAGW